MNTAYYYKKNTGLILWKNIALQFLYILLPVGAICGLVYLAVISSTFWLLVTAVVLTKLFFLFVIGFTVTLTYMLKYNVTSGQYIDRAQYKPVNYHQNVVTYTLMQLILGCLATLDLFLLCTNPIDYIRQIAAHFQGAVMRPCYFVYDRCFNDHAYASSIWISNGGFCDVFSSGGTFRTTTYRPIFDHNASMKEELEYRAKVEKYNKDDAHAKQEQEEIMEFAREHRGFCMDKSTPQILQGLQI